MKSCAAASDTSAAARLVRANKTEECFQQNGHVSFYWVCLFLFFCLFYTLKLKSKQHESIQPPTSVHFSIYFRFAMQFCKWKTFLIKLKRLHVSYASKMRNKNTWTVWRESMILWMFELIALILAMMAVFIH